MFVLPQQRRVEVEVVTLGQQIRARREEVELTQMLVAGQVDVNRATIRALEQDRNVEIPTLLKVLRELGCTPTAPTKDHPRGGMRPVLSAGLTRMIHRAFGMFAVEFHENDEADEVAGAHRLRVAHDAFWELVDAAAAAIRGEGAGLPASFDDLRSILPEPQLRSLDNELVRIFGDSYPYRHTRANAAGGGTSSADATRIVRLGATRESDAPSSVRAEPDIGPASGKAHFHIGIGLDRPSQDAATTSRARPEILAILGSDLPEASKAELIEYAVMRQHQLGMQLVKEVERLIVAIRAGVQPGEERDYGDRQEDQ